MTTPTSRELAEAIHDAINAHSAELQAKRDALSIERYGRVGAHIEGLYPTRESEIAAIEA